MRATRNQYCRLRPTGAEQSDEFLSADRSAWPWCAATNGYRSRHIVEHGSEASPSMAVGVGTSFDGRPSSGRIADGGVEHSSPAKLIPGGTQQPHADYTEHGVIQQQKPRRVPSEIVESEFGDRVPQRRRMVFCRMRKHVDNDVRLPAEQRDPQRAPHPPQQQRDRTGHDGAVHDAVQVVRREVDEGR